MRRLGLLLGLALTACQSPPSPAQLAEDFIADYHDGSWTRTAARHVDPSKTARADARIAWLRERVGTCSPPTPLWAHSPNNNRFRYTCERGGIEASFVQDDQGRITELRYGAIGIPVEEPLASAVQRAVTSLPWSDADVPPRVDQDATGTYARELGRCTLDRPWVISAHSGLFHVRCDHGDAILRISIDPDGTLRQLRVLRPEGRRDDPDAV